MTRWWVWTPLVLFALFAGVAAWRLSVPDTRTHVSALVGEPLPVFSLPPAVPGKPGVASGAAAPRLVNVFASWCIPCATEAPALAQLRSRGATIDAIAIRDRPEDVAAFLQRNGDPFRGVGLDPRSQVQIALGSAGVPETFVVDGRGVIRHQHIGPVRDSDVPILLAALAAAR